MKAIRQRVAVRDGRIEISDPALDGVTEADVVVLLPEPVGDGEAGTPPTPWADPGGLPLVDDDGRPVFLPPVEIRPGRTLMDLFGLAPSGRTAEEIDREIRDFRGDDPDDE